MHLLVLVISAKSTRDVVIVAYSAQSFMSFIDPHFLRVRPRFLKLRLVVVVASSSLAKTWGEGHLIPIYPFVDLLSGDQLAHIDSTFEALSLIHI